MLNSSILNSSNITAINLKILDKSCFKAEGYDLDCVLNTVCPQLNQYFVRTGLIIVISYIVMSWFLWWFFKYGYKKFKYDKTSAFGKWIGNLDILETRVYWDSWIRTRMTKLCLGYIVVVVWINR